MRCCSVFVSKQKTACELCISDWSSDVCSSDLQTESAVIFVPHFPGEGRGPVATGPILGPGLRRGSVWKVGADRFARNSPRAGRHSAHAGLQMAVPRASGAHVPKVRCASGHEKPPFSARPELTVDRPLSKLR